jgi:hypothetical protein
MMLGLSGVIGAATTGVLPVANKGEARNVVAIKADFFTAKLTGVSILHYYN